MHGAQWDLFKPTLDQQYEMWAKSEEGRQVKVLVVERAKQLRGSGYKRYGIKAILEAIRFDRDVQFGPASSYKVNNNISSRLARDIMFEHPELAGFFELRQLHDDGERPTSAVVVPIRYDTGRRR